MLKKLYQNSDVVEQYYSQGGDELDPFVVCDNVSVDDFNKYMKDDELRPFKLRSLYLRNNGQLVLAEYPFTCVHECTRSAFNREFECSVGKDHEVRALGGVVLTRTGFPNHAADLAYGPLRCTQHRKVPSESFDSSGWVTLAVEIGRYQSWSSLEEVATWWCGYEGIQYIMLMKINQGGTMIRYAIYDIHRLGILGEPVSSGTFEAGGLDASPVYVTFDMHRILAIPSHLPLPEGVNTHARVDLRHHVMKYVRRSISE